MYYYFLSLALIALGFAYLFFLDKLIQPDTKNTVLRTLRDNNLLVAAICISVGYYVYTLAEHTLTKTNSIKVSNVKHLPSYEESMSTDAVLNM